MTVRSWWAGRSLRTRLVAGSVLPLAAALLIGTVALAALFASGRLHEVDVETALQAKVLAQLASSGQLPAPLPVPAGSTLTAQVLGASGQVLAASSGASRLLPLVDDLRPGTDTIERSASAQVPLRVRVVRTQVGAKPAWVVVAAPLGDVRRATRALRLVLLVVVPLLVLAATVLARLLVGQALRPVERLRAAADGILAAGPETAGALPLPPHTDELQRLARTLNDVLTRLRGSVHQQRGFVADAAHELRSPLASMRVQLDVAGRHPELTGTADLVHELAPEVDRLTALVDDLLLLARAESGSGPVRGPVDLTALAGAVGDPVVVTGDPTALTRVVRNLRDNAERQAGQVAVSVRAENGMAVLDVDDDGPGIPAPDRLRVFDRWVRLDAGRARSEGGSGLGLAVVRDTVVAHGGTVEVLDSPLGGARLRVRLPLAQP